MEMFDDDDFIFDEIEELKNKWHITSYPMTFIDGKFVGDYAAIDKLNTFNNFEKLLKDNGIEYISNENDEF
jgi:glutaredoxin-related protein